MKRISILGSTGSIGTQALQVIENNPGEFSVAALSCGSRVEELCGQIEKFRPAAVSVAREEDARMLASKFRGLQVYTGREGLNAIASMEDCDMVLNSLVGMRGLEPTLAAVEAGRDVAFANKETLVAGGQLVMDAVKRKGIRFLPVDSEHSAIFQSLQGSAGNPVKRIVLTASGGPFRGFSAEELARVTPEQALKHPNWSMGSKVTIDSASMMNKGLEIIEAAWLFDVPESDIQVVVHPQSVLHSAVEFEDGSVIGQMGAADMRIPIGYAFSYPQRLDLGNLVEPLDFFGLPEGMTFFPVDTEIFRTVDIAREAFRRGGVYPAAVNGADEVLVDMFLKGLIGFTDIQDRLAEIMEKIEPVRELSLEAVLETDARARKLAEESA